MRFPNFYLGNDRVYEWLYMGNCDVLPTDVYNRASKYECGYGHGFDLQELVYAYEYINSSNCAFSDEYIEAFLLSYATLDINNINYIRITDIDDDSHTYIDRDPVSPCGVLEEKYRVGNYFIRKYADLFLGDTLYFFYHILY